jgi:hypothetical protein
VPVFSIANGETGASARAKLNAKLGAIIDVKADFGAVGNGSTDDTAAIQAALVAAFGSLASPNGSANSNLNKPVFFPAGQYLITSPLYLYGIQGGWIFGEGASATNIIYQGTGSEGNTIGGASDATVSPIFAIDGVFQTVIERLSLTFGNNAAGSTHTAGVYIYQTGNRGYTGYDHFRDLIISSGYTGVLAGYSQAPNGDQMVFTNVSFIDCPLGGLRTVSQNALQYSVFAGGSQNCGTVRSVVSSAAYSCVTGSICSIVGVGVSNGTDGLDFYNGGGAPMCIKGGSSETKLCAIADGSQIDISGFAFRPPTTTDCVFLDATRSGFIMSDGCIFSPNNLGSAGKIADLGNAGQVILDGLFATGYVSVCTITGTAGSRLYIRGPYWSGATPASGYTGSFPEDI